jgi:exosome complex component CSL4
MEKEKQLLLPGDLVGTGEEYLPEEGTFLDDNGNIYSSNTGELVIDKRTLGAKLNVTTRFPTMQKVGMKVIGVIGEAQGQVAFVDIPIESDCIPWEVPAVLHISRIKPGFVDSVKDEFRIGDVVRVLIGEVSKHSVLVSTKDFDCGVIRAYCSKCRKLLLRDPQSKEWLVCPECGSREKRKMASDYGTWDTKIKR